MTTILVTGATGYIGGRLVPELLDAGHAVRCLARNPSKLDDSPWIEADGVEVVQGDVTDGPSLDPALVGIEVAFFLIHSMGNGPEFEEQDRRAAATFRDACERAGVGRIVYLGGLGRDDDPSLSRHLRSRHEVGEVLAAGSVPVVELRAAVIIGSGSASFEMLRYLVETLPVMVAPKWIDNRCQPIAIRDVLARLVEALSLDVDGHRVVEVGGPDVVTYRELMRLYGEVAGLKKRWILGVPVLTPTLSSYWIGLVTPLPTGLARPLVESLINEVVVTRPTQHDPNLPDALSIRRAIELALERSTDLQVATRWSDASGVTPADPLPTDPDWAGGAVFCDQQEVETSASPASVYAVVAGSGERAAGTSLRCSGALAAGSTR